MNDTCEGTNIDSDNACTEAASFHIACPLSMVWVPLPWVVQVLLGSKELKKQVTFEQTATLTVARWLSSSPAPSVNRTNA